MSDEQETLFPKEEDTTYYFDPQTGQTIQPRKALSDPDEATIGKFQRPGDAAETQRLAAAEAYPTTGTWRRRVLEKIKEAGYYGATDEELQVALGLNPSTERPRRVELVEGGWIIDSERRRKTRSGRSAVVWVMSDAALRSVP